MTGKQHTGLQPGPWASIVAVGILIVQVGCSGGGGDGRAQVEDDSSRQPPQPHVTAIVPGIGDTAGGTAVAIHGSNLVNTSAVLFGESVVTTITVVSDALLTLESPPHAAGIVDVELRMRDGSVVVFPDRFTFQDAPTPALSVASIVPSTASTAGGVATIHGTGFTGATMILFGDVPALEFTILDDSRIQVTVPPHGAGLIDVTVLGPTGGDTLPQCFLFTDLLPVILSISPASGPANQTTVVDITGTDLPPGSEVHFGPLPSQGVTYHDSTHITAAAPPQAAGAVTVMLVCDTGLQIFAPQQFVYLGGPSGPDADGDGVSDTDEIAGYLVSVRALLPAPDAPCDVTIPPDPCPQPPTTLGVQTFWVTSDPARRDTDQDGLDDLQERILGSDPNDCDTDDDGRTDLEEATGYVVVIDEGGYGTGPGAPPLTQRHVTSDATDFDADRDGLPDHHEFLHHADPTRADTDGDNLSDLVECCRWMTSPTAVDTDGDARDPARTLPPNPALFDGAELLLDPSGNPQRLATSPTFADTDGDGVSDYVEVGHPLRSPVVADMPEVEFGLVDAVDIRLHVEYSDAVGQTVSYGEEVSTETGSSVERSESRSVTQAWEVGGEWSKGSGISFSGKFSRSVTDTRSLSRTQSESFTQAYSTSRTHATERVVTSSSGSIVMGIRATNTGDIAYTLGGLSIGVRQLVYDVPPPPGVPARRYRTLTVLTPPQGAESYTLAPGQSTAVIPLRDDSLDAGLVADFMENPTSLVFEPESYELLDASGIDFVFRTENALSRTAMIVIDYGDEHIDYHRVSTIVDRAPDGALIGKTLGWALDELGLTHTSAPSPEPTVATTRIMEVAGQADEELSPCTPLPSPLLATDPDYGGKDPVDYCRRGFWIACAARRNAVFGPMDLDVDVEALVLQPGDEVYLTYVRDEDRDSILDRAEFTLGSSDTAVDSDGDLLSDYFEALVGWRVTADGGATEYQVFSNPILVDADGDGLDDTVECANRTDPNLADTDGDSLNDAVDADPNTPAAVLHVKATGTGCGTSWVDAMGSLQDAICLAMALNCDSSPSNDVAQIWVAQGVYRPDDPTPCAGSAPQPGTFAISAPLAIYGGFAGSETRLGERSPAFPNGCEIAGLAPATAPTMEISPPSPGCFASATQFILDGFLLRDTNGAPCLLVHPGISGTGVSIRNCMFITNRAPAWEGGAIHSESHLELVNCRFTDNTSRSGGALYLEVGSGSTVLSECTFQNNEAIHPGAEALGGGICLREHPPIIGARPELSLTGCEFSGNLASVSSWTIPHTQTPERSHGGAVSAGPGTFLTMTNCSISNNRAYSTGGGVSAEGDAQLVGCLIFDNVVSWGMPAGGGAVHDDDFHSPGGGGCSFMGAASMVNCTVVHNSAGIAAINYWSRRNPGCPYTATSGLSCGPTPCGGWGEPPCRCVEDCGGVCDPDHRCDVTPQWAPPRIMGGGVYADTNSLNVQNCILLDNSRTDITGMGDCSDWSYHVWANHIQDEIAQLWCENTQVTIRNSIVGDLGAMHSFSTDCTTDHSALHKYTTPITPMLAPPPTVTDQDPRFAAAGYYRLRDDSPAIDAGVTILDAYPFTPGFDPLPDTDIEGCDRVLDGNGDGTPEVDLGAYEF